MQYPFDERRAPRPEPLTAALAPTGDALRVRLAPDAPAYLVDEMTRRFRDELETRRLKAVRLS